MAVRDLFKNLERGTQIESVGLRSSFSPLVKIQPMTYEGREVNAMSLHEKEKGGLVFIPDDEMVYVVNQRGAPKADFFEE